MTEPNTASPTEALKTIMGNALGAAKNGAPTQATYRVDVELGDGVTAEARARQFRLVIDEPPSFGGRDAGPNPEEVLLAGVGACQTITAALFAALLDIPITKYHVRLRGDADFGGFYGLHDNLPVGFERVRCDVTIEADAPEEQLRDFEAMVEARCLGHGTLRQPVPVESTLHIVPTRQTADNGA